MHRARAEMVRQLLLSRGMEVSPAFLADAVFAATPEDVLISAALACEDEAAFRAAIEASPRESEPSARLTLPERSVCSIVG